MTFFYNLNKKLDEIRATPELKHGQLNERDMGKHNNGKTTGFDALAKKAGKEYGSKAAGERVAGAQFQKMKKAGQVEEGGLGDMAKKVGGMAKKVGGAVLNKLGHGDDAEMMRDLQRKMGATGAQVHGKKSMAQPNEGVDKQSFAALAPPKDKITFADKIAGAKKEVDEMLGDVAAEAIKSALTPKQKKLDKNQNGSLDANDFAMLRKGGASKKPQVADEGWDDMMKDVERRRTSRKPGEVTHGAKHDTQEIPGGRRVTRRTDPNTGYSVGADDDAPASGEKRGRGRPKGSTGKIGAKGPSGKSKLMTKEGEDEGSDLVKLSKVIASCTTKEQLAAAQKMARNFLAKHSSGANLGTFGGNLRRDIGRSRDVDATIKAKSRDIGEEELDEKAVSKKQQKFMGMVHATQKGEKAPSKEVAKVAKTMKKSDAEDFASTKHKGLPEKKKPEAKKSDAPKKDSKPEGKKKEKTEEQGGTGTPTASSGFSFGQGIYDSLDRDVEAMIAESMTINMSMNTDANGGPSKSLTVTATEDDAMKLSELLKNAGLGGGEGPNVEGGADSGAIEIDGTMDGEGAEDLAAELRKAQHDHVEGNETCSACGSAECGCEQEMDEAYGDNVVSQNSPNWPTNQETAQDNLEYAGGLNKPKSTGQSTTPVLASQEERQITYENEELARIKEIAGIKEAKKPDFLDVDNDKNKKESFKQAVDDKEEKKVDEGILAATANLWTEYKGQYGV